MVFRGALKRVNQGIRKSIDLLGCEKSYSLALLFFVISTNVMLAFSWFQFVPIAVFLIGLMIGRVIYKNDPCFFGVFFSNLMFDDLSRQYLLSRASIKNTLKYKPLAKGKS